MSNASLVKDGWRDRQARKVDGGFWTNASKKLLDISQQDAWNASKDSSIHKLIKKSNYLPTS